MRTSAWILTALTGLAALPAQAVMVEYDWVQSGSTANGALTLDLGGGTDINNFSGVPAANLVGFSFKFANGNTVSLADLNAKQVTTWSASGGFLTTNAQLSKTGVPRYNFSIVPYNGTSTAVAQDSSPIEQDFGYWGTPHAVPLPAAAWLLMSGLAGGVSVLRRRRAQA